VRTTNGDLDDDASIPYMQRTRDYYLALGYARPYRWARYDDVPFTPLTKPLAQARLALITTAAPARPAADDDGPRAAHNIAKFHDVYSLPSDALPDLSIEHVAYDRVHTTANDPNTWLPLRALWATVAAGRLGGLTARLHGVPTRYSQRLTLERDAPELLRRCREDGADVALLVGL
jgi:hypothetical protein